MIRKNNVQAFSNRSPVYGGDSFCSIIKSYSILKASTVNIRSLQSDPTFDRPFWTKLMNGRLIHFFFVFFSMEQVFLNNFVSISFPFIFFYILFLNFSSSKLVYPWGATVMHRLTCITWLLTFVMLSRFCLSCRFQSFW